MATYGTPSRMWNCILVSLLFMSSLTLNVCGQGESTANYDVTTQSQTGSMTSAQSGQSSSNTTTNSSDPETTPAPTKQPTVTKGLTTPKAPSYLGLCPSRANCSDLGAECLDYQLNASCIYGREYNVTCTPKAELNCTGDQIFTKSFRCRYCYQAEPSEMTCTTTTKCRVTSDPLTWIMVNCTVNDDILCLGERKFYRRNRCNWTSGCRRSTALTLSITLGGFGADRFYLGSWKEGLGKLFSFGGLGVWTLVDVVLIATGYIGPEDGSHYI